jgi:DegV family protein with EDD domain
MVRFLYVLVFCIWIKGDYTVPQTAIVCDSSASVPEEIRSALDIRIVPIYIHHKDKMWRDLVDIKQEEFYRWLPTVDKLPTTAYPGPADFLKVYEELSEEGFSEVVSIHVSSKSSGTYQAAITAGKMAEEKRSGLRIHAVDSLNVAMSHGWMAIEAARAARQGAGISEIAALLGRIIPVSGMIQTADTLKYLHMGGRIGSATHMLGNMLNIKPLIGMRDGVIVPLGRERSLGKAYTAMANMAEKDVGPGGRIKVAYVHTAAPEKAHALKTIFEERFTCVESIVAELSPALGVHSGPGASGVCYYPADATEK